MFYFLMRELYRIFVIIVIYFVEVELFGGVGVELVG